MLCRRALGEHVGVVGVEAAARRAAVSRPVSTRMPDTPSTIDSAHAAGARVGQSAGTLAADDQPWPPERRQRHHPGLLVDLPVSASPPRGPSKTTELRATCFGCVLPQLGLPTSRCRPPCSRRSGNRRPGRRPRRSRARPACGAPGARPRRSTGWGLAAATSTTGPTCCGRRRSGDGDMPSSRQLGPVVRGDRDVLPVAVQARCQTASIHQPTRPVRPGRRPPLLPARGGPDDDRPAATRGEERQPVLTSTTASTDPGAAAAGPTCPGRTDSFGAAAHEADARRPRRAQRRRRRRRRSSPGCARPNWPPIFSR